MDQSSFLAVTIITIVILRSPDTDVFVLLCTKTVHNKTTSYTEIRNYVSFKTAFKIKSKKKKKHESSMFSSLGVKRRATT